LVVYDDIDLPFGTLRIRSNGGPGTHNGMRSVIDELQDRSFPRIRIGIGPKNEQMDLADYVLSKVPRDRRENWQQVINQAADAAIITIKKGLETAMQTYNKRTDEESEDSELLQS
jgi:PTH1 family peptidyl-tRNA hydrolase